ncbi:hypothetical protein GALL_96440 [mine drainage metagenome]|uniref:DoxX family protein n=1 Tax=mine drainage metagenome TaxID=410659 RepID=A0A1J5SI71_9ZZZZ
MPPFASPPILRPLSSMTSLPDTASEGGSPKSRAALLPSIARIVMGLPLAVFGLNSFFNFIPQPKTPIAPAAMAFAGALMNTGYMMPLIGITLLIVGVLLTINRFVPLALALFAPFIVNSILFHFMLEPTGRPMSAVFLLLELYLAWAYRSAFAPMLRSRTSAG